MNIERTITLLILLAGLALVTVGPLRSEPADACEALDRIDAERLDAVLDELIREGEELDRESLERHGASDIPSEALPCLRERMQQRLATTQAELSLRS